MPLTMLIIAVLAAAFALPILKNPAVARRTGTMRGLRRLLALSGLLPGADSLFGTIAVGAEPHRAMAAISNHLVQSLDILFFLSIQIRFLTGAARMAQAEPII